jgi:hypothetical protein
VEAANPEASVKFVPSLSTPDDRRSMFWRPQTNTSAQLPRRNTLLLATEMNSLEKALYRVTLSNSSISFYPRTPTQFALRRDQDSSDCGGGGGGGEDAAARSLVTFRRHCEHFCTCCGLSVHDVFYEIF